MGEIVREMILKGLIEIVRKPRSKELAELISGTRAIGRDWVAWMDYGKAVKN